jgi:hypothetical protein
MERDKSMIIEVDPAFAEIIDLGCRVCQHGTGNRAQISSLKLRRDNHSNESKAIQLIIEQCERCNRGERDVTISDQYSCSWRVGIESDDSY